MAPSDLPQSGFAEFDRLTELVRRTYLLLEAAVAEGSVPDDGADYLAQRTLPHFERLREGFRGWLRTEMAALPELRYLVLQGGVWPAVESAAEARAARAEHVRDARLGRTPPLVSSAWRGLWALGHARLVFGLLPRVPEAEVRFPAPRRTYADIAPPRGPAELAERIEEIERELWRMAAARTAVRRDPAFRRTYGFFDAAERLGRRGLRLSG